MTITTILFDVGGVIVVPLDYDQVWAERDRLAEQLGYASGHEMWLDFYESDAWHRAKTGAMVHEEMWDTLLRPHGIHDQAAQSHFVQTLHGNEGILPEMEALIASLHGRYKLGILSNWDDRLEAILEDKLRVSHYFDAILNSHRIGAAKPDPVAFRQAWQRLGARPDQLFFIDDQERNTRAAAALGLHTHTYGDFPSLTADMRQRGLL